MKKNVTIRVDEKCSAFLAENFETVSAGATFAVDQYVSCCQITGSYIGFKEAILDLNTITNIAQKELIGLFTKEEITAMLSIFYEDFKFTNDVLFYPDMIAAQIINAEASSGACSVFNADIEALTEKIWNLSFIQAYGLIKLTQQYWSNQNKDKSPTRFAAALGAK